MEESLKLITNLLIKQHSLGPTLTCTQHIAVRETATGNHAGEIGQRATASQ